MTHTSPEGSAHDVSHPQSDNSYPELEHQAKVSKLANHFRSIQQRTQESVDTMGIAIPPDLKVRVSDVLALRCELIDEDLLPDK